MSIRSSLLSYSSRALAGVLVCAWASCATPGSHGVSGVVSVPGRWQSGAPTTGQLDTASLAKWWERFHDPVLNELVTAGLAASPDVKTAVSKIAESRARRGVERASLFPWITGSGSAQNNRHDDRLTDLVTRSQSYDGTLDASWQVDLFGKQWQSVKAASEDLAQARENLYAAQVSLAAEVAEAYTTLRQTEGQLAVVQRSVATRSETLDITRWREQAGQGNALDTQQSLSTLEQAKAAIPSLQETLSQTRNRLALLLGRTPGGVDALVAKAKPIPALPPRLLIGIPADTLRQRPDVRAAEAAVLSAAARTRAAQLERLPSINISGTLSVESLTSGRIFNPQSLAASLLGSLTVPLFKGGQITANIQIQTEQEKQALYAYETKVLTALSEVENALVSVWRMAERLAILGRATVAAREAQKLAAQRYAAGEVDLLTVLEAQRTLLSVEEQQVSTQASQADAHIALYKALGGGWSGR